MRTLIVGSGPTGLLLGAALARRGHQVTSVDRDPGPTGDAWIRRGVMQFEHAHGFRPQVPMTLLAEWPEAFDQLAGPGRPPGGGAEPRRIFPAGGSALTSIDLRASTSTRGGRSSPASPCAQVTSTDWSSTAAELSALGSTDPWSRPTSSWTPQAEPGALAGRARRAADPELDGDCGLAYVDRTYRLRPGAEPGPMVNPIAYLADFDGYQCLVFLHEAGHFSVVLVRPTADAALKALRFEAAFEAACQAIPAVAEWTRAGPCAPHIGGSRRRGAAQRLPATGSARRDSSPSGTRWRPRPRPEGAGSRWPACRSPRCSRFSTRAPTHRRWPNRSAPGATTPSSPGWPTTSRSMAAWSGGGRVDDLDLSIPLTSDLIAAAVEADPRIGQHAGGYFAMTALPETLRPAEPLARAVYQDGWRPSYAPGPTRDELVDVIRPAVPAA